MAEEKITETNEQNDEHISLSYNPTEEFEWNGVNVVVKKNLGVAEMMQFVRDVSTTCFNNNTGEYLPEVRDFMVRCEAIMMYSNIGLPEGLDDKCRFVYGTDAYTQVISHLNYEQYNVLLQAVKQKVNYMAKSNVEAVTVQVNDMTAKFNDMVDSFAKIFEGIDADTLNGIAGAIANGGLDADKVAEAVLEKRTPSLSVI